MEKQINQMTPEEFKIFLDKMGRKNNDAVAFDNFNKEGTYEYVIPRKINLGNRVYFWDVRNVAGQLKDFSLCYNVSLPKSFTGRAENICILKDSRPKLNKSLATKIINAILEDQKKIQDTITPEQAAKQFIDSLSPEALSEIKSQLKSTIDKLLSEKEQELSVVLNKIEALKQEKADSLEMEKTSDHEKKAEHFRRRMEINIEIRDAEREIPGYQNKIIALKNGGDLSSFSDKLGNKYLEVPDFTKISTDYFIFNEDTILADPIPPYVPVINESDFRAKGYVFDAIKTNKDTYLLSTDSYDKKRLSNSFVFVNLDQLALISDYYHTKAKALLQKEADDKNKRLEESYDRIPEDKRRYFYEKNGSKNLYASLPAKIRKTLSFEKWDAMTWQEKEKVHKFIKRVGPKKMNVRFESNTMPASLHDMYNQFINPDAERVYKNGVPYAHNEVWAYWEWFREAMKWKVKDIYEERITVSENRKIALETSFGESNTNDTLKPEFGILVKRQDGSKINPIEINEVKTAWEKVISIFGNPKVQALADNLKISHAGNKMIFASKAIGVYISTMGTIGVSMKYGEAQFTSTMAHEFGHWIDKTVGIKNNRRWACADFESTAGKIAITLRENMNNREQNDYINSTVECFARAMQQYFMMEFYGENAKMPFSYAPVAEGEGIPLVLQEHFISYANYKEKLKPLVEKFLEENRDILPKMESISEIVDIKIENKFFTDRNKIIEALTEMARKSKSDKDFIKMVISGVGENFGLNITSNEFIEAIGLKKGDPETNKRTLKNFYLSQGLSAKRKLKEEIEQSNTDRNIENILNLAMKESNIHDIELYKDLAKNFSDGKIKFENEKWIAVKPGNGDVDKLVNIANSYDVHFVSVKPYIEVNKEASEHAETFKKIEAGEIKTAEDLGKSIASDHNKNMGKSEKFNDIIGSIKPSDLQFFEVVIIDGGRPIYLSFEEKEGNFIPVFGYNEGNFGQSSGMAIKPLTLKQEEDLYKQVEKGMVQVEKIPKQKYANAGFKREILIKIDPVGRDKKKMEQEAADKWNKMDLKFKFPEYNPPIDLEYYTPPIEFTNEFKLVSEHFKHSEHGYRLPGELVYSDGKIKVTLKEQKKDIHVAVREILPEGYKDMSNLPKSTNQLEDEWFTDLADLEKFLISIKEKFAYVYKTTDQKLEELLNKGILTEELILEEIAESFDDCLTRNGINLEKDNHRFEVGTELRDLVINKKFKVAFIGDFITLSEIPSFKNKPTEPDFSVTYTELIDKFKKGELEVPGFSSDEVRDFARVLNTIHHCYKMDQMWKESEELKKENEKLREEKKNFFSIESLEADGFKYLNVLVDMPSIPLKSKLAKENNVTTESIHFFRLENGQWAGFLDPNAKEGYKEEPILPGKTGKEILDDEFWKDMNYYTSNGDIKFRDGKWIDDSAIGDLGTVVGLANSYEVKPEDLSKDKIASLPGKEFYIKWEAYKDGSGDWRQAKIIYDDKNFNYKVINIPSNETQAIISGKELLSRINNKWYFVIDNPEGETISSDEIKEAIDGLKTLLSLTSDKAEKKEIKEAIEGLKLLLKL